MSRRGFAFIILLGVALILAFPFYVMLLGAFNQDSLMAGGKLNLLPGQFTTTHIGQLWSEGNFNRYLVNSLIVAAGVVIGNLLLSATAGYVLARKKFLGDRVLFNGVLLSLMIPKQLLMIPLYLLSNQLGLLNTYWALIIPFWADAFNVFLIRQTLASQPEMLEDAARLDGANEWQVFWKVVFPLLRPALAFCALNTLIVNWNSILFPLVLISDPGLYTLPVGLVMDAIGRHDLDWSWLFAGATVATLPLLVLFLGFRKLLYQGMVAGALKG